MSGTATHATSKAARAPSAGTILVVDGDEQVRQSIKQLLESGRRGVLEAGSGALALEIFKHGVDLVITEHDLPDGDGVDLLEVLRDIDPEIPIVLMTACTSVADAVAAMKRGAYDYIHKPIDPDAMMILVDKALETRRLRREVRSLRENHAAPFGIESIIGESPRMRELRDLLKRIAASPAMTVLLTGESGTGKDLAAKVLHHSSDRAHGPFVNITCSALPESLLESELFGHEKGAFTDARARKKGLFEQASGGTAFLDEIGELERGLQVKLLRFLEEHTYKMVGSVEDTHVDVRVIAATNRDLAAEVRAGRFREDLYYRLQVLPVELPPLRERREDVPLLVRTFIERFNVEFRKSVEGVDRDAMAELQSHEWPGNVRELRNIVERAMILTSRQQLTREDFHVLSAPASITPTISLPSEGLDLSDLERNMVMQALDRTSWCQTRAGRLLGLNRDQVRYRIEKYGLRKATPASD